jgi:hypothetical protein
MRLAFVAIAIFMAMISAVNVNKPASADGYCGMCPNGCSSGDTKCCTVTEGSVTVTCYKGC